MRALARRLIQQLKHTATGVNPWPDAYSTCTASAVVSPPVPIGPKPVLFTAASSRSSMAARIGSGFFCPNGRSVACLAIVAQWSKLPPMPTPITTGGQCWEPALDVRHVLALVAALVGQRIGDVLEDRRIDGGDQVIEPVGDRLRDVAFEPRRGAD